MKRLFQRISTSARFILPQIIALSLIMSSFPTIAAAEETDIPDLSEESISLETEEETGQALGTETAAMPRTSEETVIPEQNKEAESTVGTGSGTDAGQLSGAEHAKAKRTILLYVMGTNLEEDSGLASYNLRQMLHANFSEDDDIRFIVMTGGTKEWKLESEYLYDPATGQQLEKIDTVYNHIWEARGLDAANPAEAGKLVLLDADGILGDGDDAKRALIDEKDCIAYEDELVFDTDKIDNYEWMSDPEVLRAFINYGAENFPAEKYDLIIWDHGDGPIFGFGGDAQDYQNGYRPIETTDFLNVLSDNAVTADGGKFDFIDFDACLMNCLEYNLILPDYTDCYIASPESEPGYGQNYEEWLSLLGKNPEMDAYELGKKIVDDFISFYEDEEGDGSGRSGTLAAVNTKALMETTVHDMGFVEALSVLNGILQDEVLWEQLYYDELRSFKASIRYGQSSYYDLGNLLSQLAYVYKEADYEDLKDGGIDDKNGYSYVAEVLLGILNNPDVIYARGTRAISTDEQYFRRPDGSMGYGRQGTSGMYIVFPPITGLDEVGEYCRSMEQIAESIGTDDPRAEFLLNYSRTVAEYALVIHTGRTVTDLISSGVDKSMIDYEAVDAYWKEETVTDYGFIQTTHSLWKDQVEEIVNCIGGDVREWLDPTIRQMVEEAVTKDNIDVQTFESEEGTGYSVTMHDVRKQVVEDVRANLVVELPAMEEFLADPAFEKYAGTVARRSRGVTIGSVKGSEYLAIDPAEQGYEKLIDWMFEPTSEWRVPPVEEKWYALRDAEGTLHVTAAQLYDDEIDIPAGYITKELVELDDGSFDYEPVVHLVYLSYTPDEQGDWTLTDLYLLQEEGLRQVPVSEYSGQLEVCPVVYDSSFGSLAGIAPISRTTFMLSPETMDALTLEYTDIDNISDIADTTGDGKKLTVQMTVRNIYGSEFDITDLVRNAELISIERASVAGVSLSYGYTGKAYTPELTVKVDGETLTKDTDYTVRYENNTNPGTATITITGIGKYTGTRVKTFKIVDCVSKLVSGRTYQLIPKNNSGTAVCPLSGKMVNNTKVYITDRSSSEAMRFKAVKNTDGTWKLINAKCELVLAVQQNSSETGKGLVLYDQTTRKAQNWKLVRKFDNSFAITNAVSGLYISMSDMSAPKGTLLNMKANSGRGDQRFYIVETSAVSAPFDGTCAVKASKNKAYGLNIASSSKTDGANVNLYKYSNTNSKKFKIMYSGGGYYRLVNVNSGLVLTVKGNTKANGANVIQSKWAAQSGQRWKITKNSNGTVTLKNALGTVLHLNGNKTANGTNVVARNASTTGAQKWYLG